MVDDPFPEGMLQDIEKYLAADHLREIGHDVYDDCLNTGLFFPLQRRAELAQMMRIARSIQPRTIFEIGSDKGGGLYHWVKCLPSVQRAIACEIRGTPYAKTFERYFPEVKFLFLGSSSYDSTVVKTVSEWLGSLRIDCLFIDGDKDGFDRDWHAYRPLMSPRGVVFLHDVQDAPGPRALLERLKREGYRTQTILDLTDWYTADSREQMGLPIKNAYEQWLRYWRGASCGVGVIYLDKDTVNFFGREG